MRSKSGYEKTEGCGKNVSLRIDKVERVLEIVKLHPYCNPVFSDKLEIALHLTGGQVRQIIRHLRMKGEPIGSLIQAGYYYAATKEELQACIDQQLSILRPYMETVETLAKTSTSLRDCYD